MALSTRELLLVLRARDEASRVLRGLTTGFGDVDAAAMKAARNQISAGSALVGLGAGMAGAGAATLGWLYESTQLAVQFEKDVAKVHTQLDGVEGSMEQLGDITKRVGNDVAVPLEELNESLYTIFSSMDVNLPQAEKLLESFSKEAVAGQVSVQDASKATIGIMNAFHVPVEKVNEVLDVQFELVRKGVGSFADFNSAIGKATPSATRAGQSIETMAGMLAFMTRNGMTAAQAGVSAGRAFDALAHPKTVARLEEMGVKVKDGAGEFLQMGDIITDLQGKLANMTAPERAEALQSLFKGSGGTIQARRFYDLVLKDAEAAKMFTGLVGQMENSAGAFTNAYDTMAGTAASKSQLLANRWEILRIEVGEALLPVLNVLMDILSKVVGWWNSLSDGTKEAITWTIAIVAALGVVVGVLTAAAGVFLMLSGAAAAIGVSLGMVAAVVGGVILAIGALIAIGWLIVENWDAIKAAAKAVWDWIVQVFTAIGDWFWNNFGERLTALWNDIVSGVKGAFTDVRDWIVGIWKDITDWTAKYWPMIKEFIQPIIDWFVGIWDNIVPIVEAALSMFVTAFESAWTMISGVLQGAWTIISGVISGIIDVIMGLIGFIVAVFTGEWGAAWDAIKQIFAGIWEAISSIFIGIWEAIKGVVSGAIQFLIGLIQPAFDFIKNTIQIALEAIHQVWNFIWNALRSVLEPIVNGIKTAISNFADGIKYWFDKIKGWIGDANKWVGDKLSELGRWFSDLPGNILKALGDFGSLLLQKGKDLVQGLINGIGDMAGWLKDKLIGIAEGAWNAVLDFLGIASPSKKGHWAGEMLGLGMANGILAQEQLVADAASALAAAAIPAKSELALAAEEIMNHLNKGGQVFEDFSFKGMSDRVRQYNDQLAQMFYGAGNQLSAGSMQSFLNQQVAAGTKKGTFGVPPNQLPQSAGGGNQIEQTIVIYTQEIDPQKNGAELGFALGMGM